MVTERRAWADLAVAGAALLTFWLPFGSPGSRPWAEPVLWCLLAAASVLGGWRPWLGAALAAMVTGVGLAAGLSTEPMIVAGWCLARAAARATPRRAGVVLLVALGLGATMSVIGIEGPTGVTPQSLATAALVLAGGWALGAAVGQERAQAARTARADSARIAQAERLQLITEVHDVVTHSVATMTMTAGVGAQVTAADPALLRDKLAAIEKLGRAALAELRAVLVSGRDGKPAAGRDALAGLVGSVRAAGVDVSLHDQAGGPLPAALDRACYDVVREGLTNVLRHAPGSRCTVALQRAGDVVIEIHNTRGSFTAQRGARLGLAGLRARISALGGTLETAFDDEGGHRLTAMLPLPTGLPTGQGGQCQPGY